MLLNDILQNSVITTTYVDACTPNPCFNGGRCIGPSPYIICECPSGFMGEYCQRLSVPFK